MGKPFSTFSESCSDAVTEPFLFNCKRKAVTIVLLAVSRNYKHAHTVKLTTRFSLLLTDYDNFFCWRCKVRGEPRLELASTMALFVGKCWVSGFQDTIGRLPWLVQAKGCNEESAVDHILVKKTEHIDMSYCSHNNYVASRPDSESLSTTWEFWST